MGTGSDNIKHPKSFDHVQSSVQSDLEYNGPIIFEKSRAQIFERKKIRKKNRMKTKTLMSHLLCTPKNYMCGILTLWL